MFLKLTLLSSLYNLELYNTAFEFVCGHLPEVMQLPDMLQLTKDSLLTIITDPTLLYVKREQFFDFIVRSVHPGAIADYFNRIFT